MTTRKIISEDKVITRFEGTKCPYCEHSIEINDINYDIPNIGNATITSYYCTNCNYKSMELIPKDRITPGIYQINVEKRDDLFTKLIRGPDTSIEIAGLDMTLEPGSNAQFFYTNVESILEKFKNALESMIRHHKLLLQENKDTDSILKEIDLMNKKIELINDYLELRTPFKLILDSKEGYGRILLSKEFR